MKTIHKHPILIGTTYLHVAQNAIPRYFGVQRGLLTLWIEVEENAPLLMQEYVVIPTGGIVPDNSSYIGTAQIGAYEWLCHCYQILKQ